MKNRMLRLMRRTFSLLATIVMVGSIAIPVNAAEETKSETTGVVYAPYESGYENYMTNKVAPEYNGKDTCGYVFGGWFKSEDEEKFVPIVNTDGVTGKVYAKFVPATVLSVKCQNRAGTEAGMEGTTSLKIISALDSTNYKSYGFELDYIVLDSENNIDTEKSYSIQKKYDLDDAYKKFKVYSDVDGKNLVDTYEPAQLFGSAATYFTTHGVGQISSGQFGAIVCIKPCWTTLDGTLVYGLTKYAHVEDGLIHGNENDGYYRYVNIPINVRDTAVASDSTKGVAAGVLSVSYDHDLTYKAVEGGRVFEEMAWADKTGSVKLVGNTIDISNKTVDDIYANLRFTVPCSSSDAYKTLAGDYDKFVVSGEDFSNNAEEQFTQDTYNVWDVQY